ncbi:MAG: hypothetical protein LBK61_05005 [Spirochaetaceae bacterium]|nr:hypothetical protein [Spirochaetaceae bacterium]
MLIHHIIFHTSSIIESPCGGRKPVGFSSLREAYLRLWSKEQQHGRHITPSRRLCFPFGRAMPP